jgi:hypothetical protein
MRNEKGLGRKRFSKIEALSHYILEQSDEMQDKSHLGSPITQLRFEPDINLER